VRAIGLLLQGIELHTLDFNKEDYARFRTDMAKLQERLLPQVAEPQLYVLVGEIIKTFEAYNRQTSGKLRAQFSELQSIISTFTCAVAGMVSASDASLKRLGQIRAELGHAESIEDLRLLKTHLCDCLNSMASEVEEHRKHSACGMEKLAKGARELGNSMQRTVPSDRVTGLPMRMEADAALVELAERADGVAVIFVLKRLRQVNARFGYEVGDGLLERLTTYLTSGTNPEQGLYRWSGRALLAVISRHEPIDHIRQEVGRLIANMPEYEVRIGPRIAMIPVTVGWSVFPVTRPVEKLISHLDAFINSQNEEDSYAGR